MNYSRRTIIKSGALVAGTAAALPALSYGRVIGSNEKLRAAVVGLNGRGQSHMQGFKENLVALCDCDEDILNKRAKDLDVETYVDFRKLLDQDSIDIVSIATPNHTHSLIGIAAAAAGKDVYCEKPVSHNVWEGRQLAEAAKKYDRIIQCGTQSRSSPSLQQAVAYVQDGKLGKIQHAIGTCYKPRKSIGKLDQPLKIAKAVNYDLWCGPAEKRSLMRPRLHYDWHWDFNTGNGDMGNQGIHQMDIARWFLGYQTVSPRVLSIGGRLGYEDAADTPNTQTVIHDYAEAPLIFETRGLPKAKEFQKSGWGGNMDNYRGSRIGVIVQCENGYVVIPSYTAATAYDNDNNELQKWQGGGNHFQNFLQAVENHDQTTLNAPIEEGHLSSALCHTGGVSHQLGVPMSKADVTAAVANESKLFQDSVERMFQHLSANEVAFDDQSKITLGADIKMNPVAETVIGNDRAAAMMSRDYRPGFEVPKLQTGTKTT